MRSLLVAILLIGMFSSTTMATHITGGSISYEHVAGSTYNIRVDYYKDCQVGSGLFPATLSIQVRTGNGSFYGTVTMPLITTDTISVVPTCGPNPGVCMEHTVYQTLVANFFPNNGGYHLQHQSCCRNWGVSNANTVPGIGMTLHTYIPDAVQILANSSASWDNDPVLYVCASQPMIYDHSATDTDGDSLAYKFYQPYTDATVSGYGPGPGIAPAWPTYTPVVLNPGYSILSPFEPSAPAQTLIIDANTGVMLYAPGSNPQAGLYVVGVEVEEWRNGQLLNIVRRDLIWTVLN